MQLRVPARGGQTREERGRGEAARAGRIARRNATTQRCVLAPGVGLDGLPRRALELSQNASVRWAEFLRRVLSVDILTCPHCGGARKRIAMITDGLVGRRILDHLELPSSPPPTPPGWTPPPW